MFICSVWRQTKGTIILLYLEAVVPLMCGSSSSIVINDPTMNAAVTFPAVAAVFHCVQ